MNETYRVIGHTVNWSALLGFALVLPFIVLFNWRAGKAQALLLAKVLGCMATYFIAMIVLRIPFSIAMGLGLFGIGIGTILWSKAPKIQRSYFACAMCTMSLIFTASMIQLDDTRITLRDESIDSHFLDRNRSMPRSELRIVAIRRQDVLDLGPRNLWFLESIKLRNDAPPLTDDEFEDRFTPPVSGSTVYWGPHGIIHGDDLGRRIAEYSGQEARMLPN